MTGCISGVATQFQNVTKPSFICICCGTHQLDIVLHSTYRKLGNKAFYTHLKALISYLRHQQILCLRYNWRRWRWQIRTGSWWATSAPGKRSTISRLACTSTRSGRAVRLRMFGESIYWSSSSSHVWPPRRSSVFRAIKSLYRCSGHIFWLCRRLCCMRWADSVLYWTWR